MANPPLSKQNDSQVIENANKEEANKKAQNDAVAYIVSSQLKQNQPELEQPAPGLEEENPNQEDDNIIAAYKRIFTKEPYTNKDGHYVLSFESKEQASKFFNDMAKQNHVFGVIEIEPNGNPTGHVKVSFGEGRLHEAKIDPANVGDFREKYTKWLNNRTDENKNDILQLFKNPAKDYRVKLQPIREDRDKDSQKTLDEQENPGQKGSFKP